MDLTTQPNPRWSRENNQSSADKIPGMVQGNGHALTQSQGFSDHGLERWTDKKNDDGDTIAKVRVLSGDHPIERFQFGRT